jgi:hypothetical protein
MSNRIMPVIIALLTCLSVPGIAAQVRAKTAAKVSPEVTNVPTGFQDIPFSLSKDEVEARLVEKYKMGQSGSDGIRTFYPRDGKSTLKLANYSTFLTLENFPLGDSTYTIYLHFTKSDKFYSYEFNSGMRSADNLDTYVRDQAAYFTKIFEAKFGAPAERFSPSFFNIKHGYVSYAATWKCKSHTIYTGITESENQHLAVAAVTEKILERENERLEADDVDKSAEKAASGF